MFSNVLIEKPKIKGLKNIDLPHELPFYNELNIYEMLKVFVWYARTYQVKIVDSKDPLAQLEANKSSIKDLFKNLFDEIKGFKHHATVKASLRKHTKNEDIEFASTYFDSTTKTVINLKYDLYKSFK